MVPQYLAKPFDPASVDGLRCQDTTQDGAQVLTAETMLSLSHKGPRRIMELKLGLAEAWSF
jgi:hypothetical protein